MKTFLRLLMVTAICLAFLAGTPISPAQATSGGNVTYAVDRSSLDGGERFTLSVNVDTTPGLFAAQLSLNYDNTALEVVEVRTGDVWPVGSTYASSSFTSEGGVAENIQFYATLTDSALTVPPGTLVTVLFEAKNPPAQVITQISNGAVLPLILADKDGHEIASVAPGPISVTINPAPEVKGKVTLQAPAASRPVTVNIANLTTQKNTSVASGECFSLAVPTANDYTLTATAACHLSARRTGVASPSFNTTTLFAGDVNSDNNINILDLSSIASQFGNAGVTGCANLNGDASGLVNILDLSLAASNFGKNGPTSW